MISPVRDSSSPNSSRTDSLIDGDPLESPIARSRIVLLTSFSVSLTKDSRFSIRSDSSGYHCAGLSHDCRHSFYYKDGRVSVFSLGDLRACTIRPISSRVLDRGERFTRGEPIFDTVMSSRFLVVVTSTRVLTVDITNGDEFEAITHGDWDLAGVAVHETGSHLLLALGHGKGDSSRNGRGQIEIYMHERNDRSCNFSLCYTLILPSKDRPKRLSFSGDGQILTCVTMIQNKLLVWKLAQDFSSRVGPFNFVKNHYRKVSLCCQFNILQPISV